MVHIQEIMQYTYKGDVCYSESIFIRLDLINRKFFIVGRTGYEEEDLVNEVIVEIPEKAIINAHLTCCEGRNEVLGIRTCWVEEQYQLHLHYGTVQYWKHSDASNEWVYHFNASEGLTKKEFICGTIDLSAQNKTSPTKRVKKMKREFFGNLKNNQWMEQSESGGCLHYLEMKNGSIFKIDNPAQIIDFDNPKFRSGQLEILSELALKLVNSKDILRVHRIIYNYYNYDRPDVNSHDVYEIID